MVRISPFVKKLRIILKDPVYKSLIFWNDKNYTLVILKPEEFSIKILPFFFKHCNFSSFVRQLNLYGFHKIEPDLWVFRHENSTTSLFTEFHGILRKKNENKYKFNFQENLSLEMQINEIRILEQRMFIFLSKILDFSIDNYVLMKKLVKLIKILSSEIFVLNLKINQFKTK